jgi:hypothetical protein
MPRFASFRRRLLLLYLREAFSDEASKELLKLKLKEDAAIEGREFVCSPSMSCRMVSVSESVSSPLLMMLSFAEAEGRRDGM